MLWVPCPRFLLVAGPFFLPPFLALDVSVFCLESSPNARAAELPDLRDDPVRARHHGILQGRAEGRGNVPGADPLDGRVQGIEGLFLDRRRDLRPPAGPPPGLVD